MLFVPHLARYLLLNLLVHTSADNGLTFKKFPETKEIFKMCNHVRYSKENVWQKIKKIVFLSSRIQLKNFHYYQNMYSRSVCSLFPKNVPYALCYGCYGTIFALFLTSHHSPAVSSGTGFRHTNTSEMKNKYCWD